MERKAGKLLSVIIAVILLLNGGYLKCFRDTVQRACTFGRMNTMDMNCVQTTSRGLMCGMIRRGDSDGGRTPRGFFSAGRIYSAREGFTL